MRVSTQRLHEKIEVTRLPSLPHVLLKLLEVCQQEDASFAELAAIVDKDAALSARVITIANSPALGPPKRLGSFERALVVLGLNTVKTIAITSAVQQFFSRFRDDDLVFLKQFWRQSLLCALLARALAKLTSYASPDEAYITGLLHDVGRLVLASIMPEEYGRIRRAASTDRECLALEVESFGVSHDKIGSELVRNWELDSFMSDAVLYHHEPVEHISDAHQLVKLLKLANSLAGCEAEPDTESLATADALFGLTYGMTGGLFAKCLEELADVARYMDIDVGGIGAAGRDTTALVRDQVKQAQLGREVRDMALAQGALGGLSNDGNMAAALSAIDSAVTTLFGPRFSCVFLFDAEHNMLRGSALPGHSKLIDELAISLVEGRSIIADALLRKAPIDSFAIGEPRTASVVDGQVTRLSGKQGMICLPMSSADHLVGTLVIAVDQSELPRLWPQRRLMVLFASQAAHGLAGIRSHAQTLQRGIEESRQAYRDRDQEIVHEASNPLAIVRNYLEGLAIKLGEEHPAHEDIRLIREEIDRITTIIRRLTDTPEAAVSVTADINQVVRDLLRLFRDTDLLGSPIDVQIDLDERVPVLAMARDSIKQVLTNLVKNALEAMPEGGVLRVATRDRINFEGKQYVELTVADSGPGIPSQVLARLYEPTATTKGRGHAGLGLSIVKNLLNELGGYVSCRTGPETGTSFQILLPRIMPA